MLCFKKQVSPSFHSLSWSKYLDHVHKLPTHFGGNDETEQANLAPLSCQPNISPKAKIGSVCSQVKKWKKYNKKYETHDTGLSKVKKGVLGQNASSSVISLSLTHKHTYKTTWTGSYLVRGKKTSHIHLDCCTSSSVSSFNIKVIIKK